MRQLSTLARWFAVALVAGTLSLGAVVPAEAASQHADSGPPRVHVTDTGWNGT